MYSFCKQLLTTLVAVAALLLPQYGAVAQEGTLASCNSSFIQGLLNAPMLGSPRDDIWVLLALDKVRVVDACQGLDVDSLANYLERQWVNDVVGEPLSTAKTVAEAIRIENGIERSSTVTMEKLRQRAHSRSFSAEMRNQADALPRGAKEPPQPDNRKARNIWPSRNMSPPGIAVAIAFTNITQRMIFWPTTDLMIRKAESEKYVRFGCESEKRNIAPLERFVVFCSISETDWGSDDEGLALLGGLKNRDNWFLRPDDTQFFRATHQRIMYEIMTNEDAQRAIDYVGGSSCVSRRSCSEEFIRSPLDLRVQLAIWWLPSLLLAATLFATLRRLAPSHALGIAWTLSALLVIATGYFLQEKVPGAGWGGILLLIYSIAACAGAVVGVWLMYLWQKYRERGINGTKST
ncbi:MAG TPA: hypothetical protein VJ001_05305 [Rhodocyclaceae bacterium]|nr:hypothetical protein [Rhodocyclaceae bacterium]